MSKLINFMIYQLGWFVCVLGAAWGWPGAGVTFTLIALAWVLYSAPQPRAELQLVLIAAVVGALWDSALSSAQLVHFSSGAVVEGAAPHWMVALWALFAMTLNQSLAWLKKHLWAAVLLGAVGGPLAYLAGARLGALALPQPTVALVVLAMGWAVITPLLCLAARRYDGYRAANTATPETRHA